MNKLTRIGTAGAFAAILACGIALPAQAANAAPLPTVSATSTAKVAPTISVDSVDQSTRAVQFSGTAAPNSIVQVQREQAGRYFTVSTATANSQGAWKATATAAGYGTTTFRAYVMGAPTNDGRSYVGATIARPVTDAKLSMQVLNVNRDAKSVLLTGTGKPGSTVTLYHGHELLDVKVGADGTWTAVFTSQSKYDWNRFAPGYLKIEAGSSVLGQSVIVKF